MEIITLDENKTQSELLLPADINEILNKYGHLLQSYTNLRERDSVFANYKLTTNKLSILFPLKEHPIHGITGLHATEKYDNNGFVKEKIIMIVHCGVIIADVPRSMDI